MLENLIKLENLPVRDVQPLEAELHAFLDSVRTGAAPAVTGEDGVQAMDVAGRILDAVRESLSSGVGKA